MARPRLEVWSQLDGHTFSSWIVTVGLFFFVATDLIFVFFSPLSARSNSCDCLAPFSFASEDQKTDEQLLFLSVRDPPSFEALDFFSGMKLCASFLRDVPSKKWPISFGLNFFRVFFFPKVSPLFFFRLVGPVSLRFFHGIFPLVGDGINSFYFAVVFGDFGETPLGCNVIWVLDSVHS